MNKTSRSHANSNPADLRSDIDHTRQRLDSTIDAIASRLRGRHLMDEALHFVRAKAGDGEIRQKASEMKGKLSDSAGTVVHAVADTVKAHPLPTLLIGAGLAWLAYETKRPDEDRAARYPDSGYDPDYDARRDAGFTAAAMEEGASAGAASSLAGNYTSAAGEGESKFEHLKEAASEKAGELKERVRRGTERIGERARARTHEWRERSGEMRDRLQERAGAAYGRARDGVTGAIEQHPLESAIACVAAGVLAGLLLPTPRRIDEAVGPTSERVRRRVRDTARDTMERGRHVAHAAAEAAREEARAQGLTPDGLRESAASVAGRAREAASETARKEATAAGLPTKSSGSLPSPEADERRPSPDDAASSGF